MDPMPASFQASGCRFFFGGGLSIGIYRVKCFSSGGLTHACKRSRRELEQERCLHIKVGSLNLKHDDGLVGRLAVRIYGDGGGQAGRLEQAVGVRVDSREQRHLQSGALLRR